MKKTLFILLPLLLIVGCSKPINDETLIDKDGEFDGKWTWWYENGQKKEESTYKDGEIDGKWTHWYENGQKKEERTWKDWELIDSKCWDEDGNECECSEYRWEGCN